MPLVKRDSVLIGVLGIFLTAYIRKPVMVARKIVAADLLAEKLAETSLFSFIFLFEKWAFMTAVFMPFKTVFVGYALGDRKILVPGDSASEW